MTTEKSSMYAVTVVFYLRESNEQVAEGVVREMINDSILRKEDNETIQVVDVDVLMA